MLKFFLYSVLLIAVILISILLYGHHAFDQQIDGEVAALFGEMEEIHGDIVTPEDLIQLPEPVQRWLTFSGIVGKEKAQTVRLKQEGKFRQTPEQKWLPFSAEEYYTTPTPAFIWYARIQAGSLFTIAARDRLSEGKGNMLIKLLSLFTIADAYGKELDEGIMLRYLDEIVWFPSAALSEYILWEPVDDNSAQATLSYAGHSVSARFYFDKEGRVINVESERHRELNGEFFVEKWSTPFSEYGEFNGIKLPVSGKAIWHLKTGDFDYFDVHVTAVEYNTPSVY